MGKSDYHIPQHRNNKSKNLATSLHFPQYLSAKTDVERLIEEERKYKPELRGRVGQMTWDDYYSFDQVENG